MKIKFILKGATYKKNTIYHYDIIIYAFSGCSSLSSIKYKGINNNMFSWNPFARRQQTDSNSGVIE